MPAGVIACDGQHMVLTMEEVPVTVDGVVQSGLYLSMLIILPR